MALRELTPKEVSQLIDNGTILNEAGAPLLTRWLAKTFAANPEEAAGFLERQGFEVKRTDRAGKMQFAIRNKAMTELLGAKNNQWKVLDPEGFDWGDIVDIAFDVFVAGPVIGATIAGGALAGSAIAPVVGTAVGAAAGGAVGTMGVESMRQVTGGLLGVNKQPDIGGVARASTLGALLPGVTQRLARFPAALLKAGKWATKKSANLGRNLAAVFAGTTEEALESAAESAPRMQRILQETAPKPISLLDRMRGTLHKLEDVGENQFPETREINRMLEKARRIPIRGLLDKLEQRNVMPVGDEKVGVISGRRIARQIAARLGFASVAEAKRARITVAQARDIKSILQKQTDFSGRPGSTFKNELTKSAQANLARRMRAALPSSKARARHEQLTGKKARTDDQGVWHPGTGVQGKMDLLRELNKRLGEHKQSGAQETWLTNITGSGRTQERRMVEQFDRQFGTNFIEEATTSRLAGPFSRDAPKLTAMGRFRGAAAGVGVGTATGAAFGGVPGGMIGGGVGGVAGTLASTPKNLLRLGGVITGSEKTIRAGIKRGGQEVQRAQPLMDYLARSGAGTAASMGARDFDAGLPPDSATIEVQGQGTKADAVRALVEEVNALPGLDPTQRMDEFHRRFQALEGGAP